MVGEVFAGVGAFKAMFDAAKALKDINDAAIRNAAVVELQEQILAAQQQQATLAERVRTLEAEVAKFEDWEAQKNRYEMQRFEPGVFLYALKQDMAAGEPAHCICPNCYAQRKKSVLHSRGLNHGIEIFDCKACGEHFRTGKGGPLPSRANTAPPGRPQSWMR